ncbi:MAG: TerB N-terminal domain-containing protein [Thermomicrobiales bacterium]
MSAHRPSWRFQRQNRPDPRGRGIVLYDFEGDLLGDDPETTLTWIGPGEQVTIGGYALSDPMIYAGLQPDIYHPAFEPSAIDLEREIAPDQPPRAAISTHSWQPWAAMTPNLRGSYLAWVATGRRDVGAPDSFPSLYLCGLERRLFVDLGISGPVLPKQEPDVRAIRDEVAALVETHGRHLALGNASRLLAILNLILKNASAFAQPPALDPDQGQPPLELTIGLGILVAAEEPIPPEWALAWAWYLPNRQWTSVVTRCPEEVRHLFLLRYRREHGAGMVIRRGLGELSPRYEPMNTGVPQPRITLPGLPDVFLRRQASVTLDHYATWSCHDLTPYANWIARNPTRAGTTMALLHVPAQLLESDLPSARRVRTWLDLTLGEYGEPMPSAIAVAAGADLIALWGQEPPDRLTKGESEMLGQVLERFGAGIEPDIRFEGSPLTSRMPVAIFRPPDGFTQQGHGLRDPSMAGEQASLALALGAPLLTTDDPARPLTDRERSILSRIVGEAIALTPLEAVRIQAAIARLSPLDPKPSGLKRRIDALHAPERATIGEILVRIAGDGANDLPPKMVGLLQKHFRALRLDPDDVPGRLHGVATARPAPRSRTPDHPSIATVPSTPRRPIQLDREAVSRTQEESEAVSALLGGLLTEETIDAAPAMAASSPALPETPPIEGLDAAHSAFLQALSERETWPGPAIAALAEAHHLLPGGAIDTINEWAITLLDEPLITDGDPLMLDLALLSAIPFPRG